MLENKRIGFIGGGRMGEAIARGLPKAGVSLDNIRVSDPDAGRRDFLRAELGLAVTSDNAAAVEGADIIILAVKPYTMTDALKSIREIVKNGQLVVSIAAGIRTSAIENVLGQGIAVVRVMPNTSCLIGEGMSALAPGSSAGPTELDLACAVFEAVGRVVRVTEGQMDAVTGLSGSGPAYVYMFIQALADGGVRAGLSLDTALTLAAQTVRGAAGMVLETGENPMSLRDKVMTPGGTTVEGVGVLERGRLSDIVSEAVLAAARRSAELGRK